MDALKQMVNGVKVVGKLKTKNLQYDEDDKGVALIRGNVVVEVKNGDKLNNIYLNVYTKAKTNSGKDNGFYKGFQTVLEDYKDADTYGDDADIISVVGDISFNVYTDANDNLRQNNRIRANRFHRLGHDNKIVQEATGTVGVIIMGYKDIMDEDGVPTGEQKVKALSILYGGKSSTLVGLQVNSDVQMADYVPVGTPCEISFDINNYVVVKKQKEQTNGFGNFKDVTNHNSFTSNLEITGGQPSNYEFTDEQLQEAVKNLRSQIEEAKNNTSSKRAENFVKHDKGFNNFLDNAKPKNKKPATTPKSEAKPAKKEPESVKKQESKTENAGNPFDGNNTVEDDAEFDSAW